MSKFVMAFSMKLVLRCSLDFVQWRRLTIEIEILFEKSIHLFSAGLSKPISKLSVPLLICMRKAVTFMLVTVSITILDILKISASNYPTNSITTRPCGPKVCSAIRRVWATSVENIISVKNIFIVEAMTADILLTYF